MGYRGYYLGYKIEVFNAEMSRKFFLFHIFKLQRVGHDFGAHFKVIVKSRFMHGRLIIR